MVVINVFIDFLEDVSNLAVSTTRTLIFPLSKHRVFMLGFHKDPVSHVHVRVLDVRRQRQNFPQGLDTPPN